METPISIYDTSSNPYFNKNNVDIRNDMPLLIPMKQRKVSRTVLEQNKNKQLVRTGNITPGKRGARPASHPLKCRLCPFTTMYSGALSTHFKSHDNDTSSDEMDYDTYKNPFTYENLHNAKDNEPIEDPKMSKEWVCLFCDRNLETKEALIDHYAIHTTKKLITENNIKKSEDKNYQCSICGKKFISEITYGSHMETHGDLQLACEFCKICFKYLYEYSVHSRVHSAEQRYECYMCTFTTLEKSQVKPHLKRHQFDYKYTCDVCKYVCNLSKWFEEHKNIHTGAKPFGCDACEEKFAGSRDLIAHKQSMNHFNENKHGGSFECEHCNRLFPNEKQLMSHVKRHKVQSNVLCDVCGKGLSSRYHLKLHRRIHTGYKPFCCSICGKSFSKKSNLILHERVHSGERPYQCTYCEKSFSQRSTLVIHTRYHTGDRPYACHICKRTFVCKGLVTMHLKNCNGLSVTDDDTSDSETD